MLLMLMRRVTDDTPAVGCYWQTVTGEMMMLMMMMMTLMLMLMLRAKNRKNSCSLVIGKNITLCASFCFTSYTALF